MYASATEEATTYYFNVETKLWKPLPSVIRIPIGRVNKACFIVEYVRNYLYLAANVQKELYQESVIFYRYHVVNNSWEKLPELKSNQKIDCLCSVGGFVYAISESNPPQMYSLADNTWQQGGDNLNLFKPKYSHQLNTVAAAVMNSKIYVIHGCRGKKPRYAGYISKAALVHCFDPTKNEWEQIASTCHPHFGSSLFVVSNKLYVAGGKMSFYGDNPFGQNAPVEVYNEKKRTSSWLGRRKGKQPNHIWSVVEQKHIPPNDLGAVEIEGRVYFIINKFPIDSGIRIPPGEMRQVLLNEWENLAKVSDGAVLCYLPVKREDLK